MTTALLSVRIDSKDKARLQTMAKERRISLSELVREKLVHRDRAHFIKQLP